MNIANKVNKEYVNASIEITKALTQLGATVALGFLPEQEYLDNKISWYDAKLGSEISGTIEAGAGVLWPFIENPFYSALITGNALGSIGLRFARKPETPGQSDNLSILTTKDRLGNIYLETAWRTGKNLYNKIKK